MSPEARRFELQMKADRVLYRLPAEQIAYLGDTFPWAVTDEDLQDRALVDSVRQTALGLGHRATAIAASHAEPSWTPQ